MSLSDIHSPAPKETLRIQNFGGITDATIELSRMNVFIGPQASGKSVCAKLIYYFREIVRGLPNRILKNMSDQEIREQHIGDFHSFFPHENWMPEGFKLEYENDYIKLEIMWNGGNPLSSIWEFNPGWNELKQNLRKERENTSNADLLGRFATAGLNSIPFNFAQKGGLPKESTLQNNDGFINAGRSFFVQLKNITFMLQANQVKIDPFMLVTGKDYESAKSYYFEPLLVVRKQYPQIEALIKNILKGDYRIRGNREHIFSEDGRSVLIENSSSGQQEALPLVLILSVTGRDRRRSRSTTLFVEEPEAHLYPDAQREMVHLLCTALDLTSPESSSQCVITTHSPYILSALNNLIYGAKLIEEEASRKDAVHEILGETDLVSPKDVRAYHFENGSATRIQDEETGLITADAIDEVSQRLGVEFERLLSVEFAEKAA